MQNNYLAHYGILGMRWGHRSGRSISDAKSNRNKANTNKQKRYLKIGAAYAATALGAYGLYKLSTIGKESNYIKSAKYLVENDLNLMGLNTFSPILFTPEKIFYN